MVQPEPVEFTSMEMAEARHRARILVVGRSPVTSVVVSRIVERIGLRARRETPETCEAALAEERPAIVILDTGPADADCDLLIVPLRRLREDGDMSMPAVILLSTAARAADSSPIASVADMILAKPITVDRLQPAIEALRARNGDYGAVPLPFPRPAPL